MTLPVNPHFPVLAGGIELVNGSAVIDTGLRELQAFCATLYSLTDVLPPAGSISWSPVNNGGPTAKVTVRAGVEKTLGVAATGSITTVAKALLLDGETFTLNDGLNGAKVFEFDVNGTGVTTGRVRVNVSTDTTADNVRDRIIAAMNAASNWNITASSGGAATVNLVNDLSGTLGNQTSSETVADVGFAITNMSGGVNEVLDDTVARVSWIALGK